MTNQLEMVNGVLQPMNDADQASFIAMQTSAVSAQTLNQLLNSAMGALIESDKTILRISEAISLGLTTWTASDVVAWINYRRTLRQIISSRSGTLPTKPAYPYGT